MEVHLNANRFYRLLLECKHNSLPACYGSEMFPGLLRKAHQGLLKFNLIIQKSTFSVRVFSNKVLIGDTILTSPTGDGTTILSGHQWRHAKYSAKGVPTFLGYFKTLSVDPAPGTHDLLLCSQAFYRLSYQ